MRPYADTDMRKHAMTAMAGNLDVVGGLVAASARILVTQEIDCSVRPRSGGEDRLWIVLE